MSSATQSLPYLLAISLLAVGVYGLACKRNVVKMIISAMVCEYAVNLFLVLQGYRAGGEAPILTRTADPAAASQALAASSVDPLPQALILTSIVIGLGVTALMVALAIRLYEKHGTYDLAEIRQLRG